MIPAIKHFPATPKRIRVLQQKTEDTLAAGTEQCVAGSESENGKWKIENRKAPKSTARIGRATRAPEGGDGRSASCQVLSQLWSGYGISMMMCWGSSSTGALSRAMARVVLEELIGDVAQDGSAARGDAALSNEGQEPREKLVYVNRGVAFGEFGEKFGGEVLRVVWCGLGGGGDQTGVTKTKVGNVVEGARTAGAPVRGEV